MLSQPSASERPPSVAHAGCLRNGGGRQPCDAVGKSRRHACLAWRWRRERLACACMCRVPVVQQQQTTRFAHFLTQLLAANLATQSGLNTFATCQIPLPSGTRGGPSGTKQEDLNAV